MHAFVCLKKENFSSTKPHQSKVKKVYTDLLLICSICASLLGIVAFLVLFIPDINIYWIILSPVIIVCYQIPAVLLYWLYKKNRPSDSNDT